MQTQERYQFTSTYFMNGIDYKGHVVEIDAVDKCKKLCSGHDPGGYGCDDQSLTFHLVTGLNMALRYDEICVVDLQRVTKPVLLKPDNLFEVY